MWPFSSNSAEFGPLRRVRLVGVVAGVLPDDLLFHVDFNNAVVSLVGDEDMEGGRERALHGSVQRVRPVATLPKLTVLPDDLAHEISEDWYELSGAPPGLWGITPAGVPVPAIRV